VPNWFTGRELRGLSALADDENDHSLATAASSSPNGEITQTLAAGPQLIDYYEHAADPRDCYGKAIITAAMDARRLGHASTLPAALLQAAAPGYLTDDQRKQARAAWFAEGLQYARKKVRNVVAALNDVPRPTGMGAVPDVYRLADYLDQYGRSARCTHCPPASFWDAVQKYVTSATELDTLADAAQKMGRYQIATAVAQRAAQSGGGFGALYRLAEMRKEARNWDEAKQIYRYIANASQADDTLSRGEIFRMLMHASQDTLPGAPQGLVQMWDEVSRLFPNIPRSPDQATAQDYLDATHNVLNTPQGRNRVRGKATEDFSDPVRRGLPDTPLNRGHAREKSGDLDGAERLYLQAAAKGDRYAPLYLARLYGKTGRLADAEPLWRDLASTPNWSYTAEAKAYLALTRQKMFIARIQEESQTRPDAQRLYQQAADTGHTLGPSPLTQAPEAASIPDDSEQPFQQARNANGAIHPETLSLPIEEWREAYLGRKSVLLSREGAGDSLGAERMAQQAAEVGDSLALLALAHIREQAGDPQSAEQLAVQAINVGSALHADLGLMALADMRKRAGNREDSQRTRRFGLNADGSPENADPESNSAADDLVIRRTEAARLEKSGQYAQAVDLWRSLIDSYTGTLGPNHAGTLESRHELAICLSKSAGGAAAIAVWRPLVQDRSRVLGIDHPDTLRTRYCLAVNLWGLGEDAEAEAMSRPLINDCVRVLGPDDPMTLAARENLALSLGGLGRLTEAITVLQALVEDRARVLGVDHHDTLTSRYSLARYLEDSGRSTEAVELFQPLVEDCARVCGADNFLTLDARYGLAVSLGKTRIATKALPLWRSLVDDLTRVRGPDDSRTLGARFLLAVTLGAQRRYAESVDVLRPLARDRTRILGADHTDTVATRQLLHGCLGLRTSRSRRGRGPR
jgi:hypothetical protein